MWKDRKEKNQKKKDHLEAKHKPRKEGPVYKDIPISDERLDDEFGDEEEGVEVFGYGVEVDEDEKEFLRLPKSATDYVKVDEEDVKTSIQVMAAKLRMSIREMEEKVGRDPARGLDVQNSGRVGDAARGLEGEAEDAVLASKRVFDVEGGTVDFKKKQVTAMVTCKRITVPEAAENQKETKIQVLVNNLEDVLRKGMKEEARCLRAGNPVKSTMTESALRGRARLLEREKAGELVLVCSDKSGKLYPMSKELYRRCMEPHIAGDSVHTRADVSKAENEFNGAARQVLRAFKFGEDWQQESRFVSACKVENNEAPSMNQLVKDHKETLKTRPVARAKVQQAPNGPLADLLCEVLNPFVAEADKDRRTDVKSTEELCAEFKAANERMARDGVRRGPYQLAGGLVVGSKDVSAHYPSIDIDVAAEEAKLEIEESNLEIEVNTAEVALYLASSMSQAEVDAEGLTDVVHKRRHKKGSRPGLTSKSVTGGPAGRQKDCPWLPPSREPTRAEKMKMVGCLLRHAIRLVMKNHFYSFDNQILKQSKGGAIGNKLTERLGKLLMKRHSQKYLRKLQELELRNEVFEVYVDDTTDVLAAVDPGVRFDGESLVKHEELVEDDEKIPEVERTMNILKDIANTIFDCVQLTVDCTSSHQDGKVPILDLKVYTKDNQIYHEFYEKPCASKMVIPYKSAHSRKMKMAVLVEEGVRRMRNASRGLDAEVTRRVMAEWSRKLRRSGYPETVRHEVIRTADERWRRMCEEEDSGVRPVHRPRGWKARERRLERERKVMSWHSSQDNQPSAPLILDPTAGCQTKEMKDVCAKFEEVTGMRVSVVERAGASNKRLAKSEPLKRKGCGREECFPCSSGGGKCDKNGVGYRIRCETCRLAGRSALYDGESGNNAYSRGCQHQDALRLETEESPLWKHCLLEHQGQKAKFSMKALRSFTSCLVRQVNEAVRIEMSTADCMLYSKSEFHQAPLVRVVPVVGLREEQGVEEQGGGVQGGGRGRGRGGRARGRGRGRNPGA